MATSYSYNSSGATPSAPQIGPSSLASLQSAGVVPPAAKALNNFGLGGNSGTVAPIPVSSSNSLGSSTSQAPIYSPAQTMVHNIGIQAGLLPSSTTQTNADGSSSKVTYQPSTTPPAPTAPTASLPIQGDPLNSAPALTPGQIAQNANGATTGAGSAEPTANQGTSAGTTAGYVAPTTLPGISSGLLNTTNTNVGEYQNAAQTLANAQNAYQDYVNNAENQANLSGQFTGAQSMSDSRMQQLEGLKNDAISAFQQSEAQLGQQQTQAQGASQIAGNLISPSTQFSSVSPGNIAINSSGQSVASAPVLAPVGTQSFYSPTPTATGNQTPTAGQAQPYTIKAGDTLNAIAAANGISEAALAQANPNANPTDLQVGSQLNIPSGGGNTPFTGGQAEAQAGQGAQYQTNNATILAAQGIQQKINTDIQQNGINSLSQVNVANALNQWIAGNLSNPNYANFFNDLTDYSQTIAPLIGIGGSPTDMKTAIGQQLINGTNSGQTITQVLDNLNQLALNKNNSIKAAGQGGVGQGAVPNQSTGSANGATTSYTDSTGKSYSVVYQNGKWVVQ